MLCSDVLRVAGLRKKEDEVAPAVPRQDRVEEVVDHEVDQHPRADAVDDGGVLDPAPEVDDEAREDEAGELQRHPGDDQEDDRGEHHHVLEAEVPVEPEVRLPFLRVLLLLPRLFREAGGLPPFRGGPGPKIPLDLVPHAQADLLAQRLCLFRGQPRNLLVHRRLDLSCDGVPGCVLLVVLRHSRHSPIGHGQLSGGTKLAGGFHSATFATFARSLRFRSTQSLPHSIRRCVEPPAALLFRPPGRDHRSPRRRFVLPYMSRKMCAMRASMVPMVSHLKNVAVQ